ncbi:MAG: metalloregulator ArsR/SmtB family transcription factor [bacterium]|nr:metalloregulator ArsR/SmtB family transcription factor [bacterium]
MKTYDKIFRALGNPKRFGIILYLLKKHEATVEEIAGAIKLSHTSTSKHLVLLDKLDVVVFRRESRYIFYRLNIGEHHFLDALLKLLK